MACKNYCCTKIKNFNVSLDGKDILKNINLHLHCGELIALVGPNGAGKTTLFKAILGEVKHTGEIFFMNEAGEKNKPKFGYVPQKLSVNVVAPITVFDCMLAFNKDKAACENALKKVDCLHIKDSKISSLSGGELQRVLLARVLLFEPNILLLDEATSGMDTVAEKNFWDILSTLRKNQDMAIVIITHNFNQTLKHADKCLLLNKKILQLDTPEKVLMSDEFKELFL